MRTMLATASLFALLLSCGADAALAADTCNAAALRGFIGKPKEQLPVNLPKDKTRILCSTCAGTMDYSPTRLDIIYDSATGLVTRITCG